MCCTYHRLQRKKSWELRELRGGLVELEVRPSFSKFHLSWRVTFQNQLTADEYFALMKDELEDLAGHRLKALINVEANKARVSRWYDKKVKVKTFEQGKLVWKLILPIGTKSSKFGKWSPTWEGPFRVNRCVPGNAYILETLEGEEYSRALNGKYLKKYYPSVQVDEQPIN